MIPFRKHYRDYLVQLKNRSGMDKCQLRTIMFDKKLFNTLREETTFADESFAISRFLAQFAKVCSREIFVIYKSRKFILAKKIRA